MEKNIKKILNNEKTLTIVIAVLVVLFAILLSFPNITTPIKNIMNKEKVYSVDVIKINGCDDCFDLNGISSSLNKIGNIIIKNEKELTYNSVEGKKLIEKYNIKKVPALIVLSKNLGKINLDEKIFRKENKAAIFDKSVPYLEIDTGKVNGIVNLKEIFDSSCTECASPSNIQKQLESLGVKIGNYEKIDYLSIEGQQLIKESNINFLPVTFVSKDIEEYWWVFSKIKDFLTANEKYYFFKEPIAPYKEISTGKIKGKVNMTYITNKSCEDCFNVTQLKDVFSGIGIYIFNERYVDVDNVEGKNLLKIYNITAIPTVVMSSEINDYSSLKEMLEQVGTFENDNTYVFRKLDVLKVKYQKTRDYNEI